MEQDKKTLRRILQLLKDTGRNGYDGTGKPERLSGDLAAYRSRRTDDVIEAKTGAYETDYKLLRRYAINVVRTGFTIDKKKASEYNKSQKHTMPI